MRTELERRLERQWLQDRVGKALAAGRPSVPRQVSHPVTAEERTARARRAGKKAAKTKRRQRVDWAKYSVFA